MRRGQLPNGLSYFIEANDTPKQRAELRLVVKAGSLEDEDQLGVAHFVEHILSMDPLTLQVMTH